MRRNNAIASRIDAATGEARALTAQHAALPEVEGGEGLGFVTATCAGVEDGMEAFEREELPEERRGHHRRRRDCQRAQRADEHPVQRRVGLSLLGDLVDRLEHRDRVRERPVVLAKRAKRVDRLDLGDDVELAASVALEGDVARRLEPGPEPARRLADPLGDRPHLAVALGEDRDDSVGLPQLDRAQNNALIAVQGHGRSLVTQV